MAYSFGIVTLNQLESLNDDELAMLLYIVNVVSPLDFPKIQFTPSQLVWFRHNMLIEKLIQAFPKLDPSGHQVFVSLMEKLGIKGEIRTSAPVELPLAQITGSEVPAVS